MVRGLGIVTAAGIGSRWGGYPKFMLPCGEGEWLLDRTINGFPCDDVAIVTSSETEPIIKQHLNKINTNKKTHLIRQEQMPELYGAIFEALTFESDYYYMAMPDTYFNIDVFIEMELNKFCLGVHYTETPERFGVLRNGIVTNKQLGEPGMAWGCLGWPKDIRDMWLSSPLTDYTKAINLAMQETPVKAIRLQYYYDMANFGYYAEFIKAIT